MSKTEQKYWRLQSAQGKIFEFFPLFEIDESSQEPKVECKRVDIKVDGKMYTFDFANLYQFIYFIANEELRRSLLLRYERKVNYIPYEVTFKISEDEKAMGVAKRRIELTVDEITMAIARNEALKLKFGFGKTGGLASKLLDKNFKNKGR